MNDDAGSGLLGTGLGIVIVGAFLLLTIDTCMVLVTRSVARSAATDAATLIARSAGADGILDADEVAAATSLAESKVAAIAGSAATMGTPRINTSEGTVTVTVRTAVPRSLPRPGRFGSTIEAAAAVRLEILR